MPSSAPSLHFGTVALVISLLAAMPALNVLGVHHLSFLEEHAREVLVATYFVCLL